MVWFCLRTFCLRGLRVTRFVSDSPKLTFRSGTINITVEVASVVPANYTWMSCSPANDRYARLQMFSVPPDFLSRPRPVLKQLRVRLLLDRDPGHVRDGLRRLLQDGIPGLPRKTAGERATCQVLPDKLTGLLLQSKACVAVAAPFYG